MLRIAGRFRLDRHLDRVKVALGVGSQVRVERRSHGESVAD
jgi:hypothetical protein